MVYLLLPCYLAALLSGVLSGRQVAVALHQGTPRKLRAAVLRQAGYTFLTLTYALLLQPGCWVGPALVLNASALGIGLGMWLAPRRAGRELSSAQLRTDAILER